MKKIAFAASLAVLLPTLALAQEHMVPPPPQGAQGTFNGAAHVMFNGSGANADVQLQGEGDVHGPGMGEHGDWRGSASGTPPMMQNASGTSPWMRGEKEGLRRHMGTTTPHSMASGTPPMMHRDASSTEDNASGTPERRTGNVMSSFMQWFFGLPASTTIGDIRTQIEASTSADVSASSSEEAPPSGNFIQNFFHSLGGFFGR